MASASQGSRRGNVDPFIVMDVMERARAAEAAGRHIIHMEVGQPVDAGAGGRAGARCGRRWISLWAIPWRWVCRSCGRGSPGFIGAGMASTWIRAG